MEIKPATIKDVDTIIKLGKKINEFQVSNKVITFWPKDVLVECIKSKNNPIFIAKEENEIKGFIICNYNPSFKKAIIENIYVSQDYREKGLGKQLLEKSIIYLKEMGCEYVCSFVGMYCKSAEKFYLSNNFNKGINCVWFDKILRCSFKK